MTIRVLFHRSPLPAREAGFTLIEMLIATAIISILAGVAVFAVGKAKDNAHKNACITERRAFDTALNTAEIEDQDIAVWISSNIGKYFQVTGSRSFNVASTSPFDINCE